MPPGLLQRRRAGAVLASEPVADTVSLYLRIIRKVPACCGVRAGSRDAGQADTTWFQRATSPRFRSMTGSRSWAAAGGRMRPIFSCMKVSIRFSCRPRAPAWRAPWYGHVPFAYWIVAALRPRRIVALGTYSGGVLCRILRRRGPGGTRTRCCAIGPWQDGEDAYKDLRSFNNARYAAFSELIRSDPDQACDTFEDGSIDLLHIDGRHTYEAARHDFDRWRPRSSRPGPSCCCMIRTCARPPFGVWRFWAELQRSYPHFEFLHERGLGVLATGEHVPDPVVLRLCTLSDAGDIAPVRSRFAFRRALLPPRGGCRPAAGRPPRGRAGARRAGEASPSSSTRRDGSPRQPRGHATSPWAERDAAQAALQARQQEADQIRAASGQEVRRIAAVAKAQEQAIGRLRTGAAAPSRPLGAAGERKGGRAGQADQPDDHRGAALDQVRQLEHALNAIERSTAWRMTSWVRSAATRVPELRRAGQAAVRALWWAAPPAPALRQSPMRSPAAPAPMVVERFSLDNIPATAGRLHGGAGWYDPAEPDVSVVVLNWNRSEMDAAVPAASLAAHHRLPLRDHRRRQWQRAGGSGVPAGQRTVGAHHLPRGEPVFRRGQQYRRGGGARALCLLPEQRRVRAMRAGWRRWCASWRTIRRPVRWDPRFLYPGRAALQEAGALVNTDGSVVQLGKGGDADDPAFAAVRQVDYISAACVVMRRSEFLQCSASISPGSRRISRMSTCA